MIRSIAVVLAVDCHQARAVVARDTDFFVPRKMSASTHGIMGFSPMDMSRVGI